MWHLQQLDAVCQLEHGSGAPLNVHKSTNDWMLKHRLRPFVKHASMRQVSISASTAVCPNLPMHALNTFDELLMSSQTDRYDCGNGSQS
jgi:hypothetical protein